MGIKKLQSTLNEIKGLAQNEGLIYWNSGAVDGSFSPWERRSLMDIKGLLVDANGMFGPSKRR
jgi:hypothetical protein